MSNQHTISSLPDVPLYEILRNLSMNDCTNLRLVSSDLKDAVDNLHGLTVAFRKSDEQDKIDGVKNLRISTLKIYSLTPEYISFRHPTAVKNLYIYNDIDTEVFHNLLNHLENVRKISIYGHGLQGNPLKFQNHLRAFEHVEDLRLFHSYENDSTASFSSICKILDFKLPNLKFLSIDFYACPRDQTKVIAEKVISRLRSNPKLTTIKLRLQECLYGDEDLTVNAEEVLDLMHKPGVQLLDIAKCHLYVDIPEIMSWIPILRSLHKASSVNIRFLSRSNHPNLNDVVNIIFQHVLTSNASTLTEVRLGELSAVTVNNTITPFNVAVFQNFVNLKILKLSRSMDDMLNIVRQIDQPFLCNMKLLPKTIQQIIIFDCTLDPIDVNDMLDGMTRLRRVTIYASAVCDNISITYAHIHKIFRQNQSIKFIEVGPMWPPHDRLDYIMALKSLGVTETEQYDDKITISFCMEGYKPKEYAE